MSNEQRGLLHRIIRWLEVGLLILTVAAVASCFYALDKFRWTL